MKLLHELEDDYKRLGRHSIAGTIVRDYWVKVQNPSNNNADAINAIRTVCIAAGVWDGNGNATAESTLLCSSSVLSEGCQMMPS